MEEFRLQLGYMVSLRDCAELKLESADFTELLLFDGDSDGEVGAGKHSIALTMPPPILFVHVQEFMCCGGRLELVDLSSSDQAIRKASVRVVNRTRELAKQLGPKTAHIHMPLMPVRLTAKVFR